MKESEIWFGAMHDAAENAHNLPNNTETVIKRAMKTIAQIQNNEKKTTHPKKTSDENPAEASSKMTLENSKKDFMKKIEESQDDYADKYSGQLGSDVNG